jgi:hypothetical protein
MKYIELYEAGDADLYHFTNYPKLLSILKINRLGNNTVVCLTRDTNHMFKKFSDAMLVLDARKLKHSYSLQPLYGDVGEFGKTSRESEERLRGSIFNLSRYLKEIVLKDEFINFDLELVKKVQEETNVKITIGLFYNNRSWFRKRKTIDEYFR